MVDKIWGEQFDVHKTQGKNRRKKKPCPLLRSPISKVFNCRFSYQEEKGMPMMIAIDEIELGIENHEELLMKDMSRCLCCRGRAMQHLQILLSAAKLSRSYVSQGRHTRATSDVGDQQFRLDEQI